MLASMLALMVGCKDATPEISFLRSEDIPVTTHQTAEFAQANLVSGMTTLSTSDGYKGKVLIHSGSELGTVKTSDQYTLVIRSLSL